VIEHLKSTYGFVPDSWEVQLEPHTARQWNSSLMAQCILKTHARFAAAGYDIPFIAPSFTNITGAIDWFEDLENHTTPVVDKLIEYAYHRYNTPPTPAQLRGVAASAASHGISSSMLEHLRADVHELHEDLSLANVSAWQQFVLAFSVPDDGNQYYWIDKSDPNNPQVNLSWRATQLRQYFRYVRRGAVRIDASSTTSAYEPLGFINPNGRYVVVIKADKAGTMTIEDLPPGTYGVTYTAGSASLVDAGEFTISAGESISTSIPKSGVVTVFDVDYIPEPKSSALGSGPRLSLPSSAYDAVEADDGGAALLGAAGNFVRIS
jgi:hypothetical protein